MSSVLNQHFEWKWSNINKYYILVREAANIKLMEGKIIQVKVQTGFIQF